jgi:alpha-1,3-mannosyl-glycoprotein beta-1,2-N-acetylglucosaminyltransferase
MFICGLFFEDLLHRSDFFPGLGWLLTKTIWNEIKDNWPQGLIQF